MIGLAVQNAASDGHGIGRSKIATIDVSAPLVTRFAPSPTGPPAPGQRAHRAAQLLAARKSGGRFILRVEDTDEARSNDAFMHELFADLQWLGLDWDEGPDVGGPHQMLSPAAAARDLRGVACASSMPPG